MLLHIPHHDLSLVEDRQLEQVGSFCRYISLWLVAEHFRLAFQLEPWEADTRR
jgi:hypothetical protein